MSSPARSRLLMLLLMLAALSTQVRSEWVTLGDTGLRGQVFRPSGAGPHPAIVALHGCAGLMRGAALNARDADWAKRLQASGFLVLLPDSYGSRGLGSQCSQRERSITPRQRADDAFAAARWLATMPEVSRSRIGLLGWSNGGSAALYVAMRGATRGIGFKEVVAFYPGCRLVARAGFSPAVPTTILHGLADDWTPAAPCQALRGIRFIGYEGAYHDFDHPAMPLRSRQAAFSAGGGPGTVTIGTHAPSREKAIGVVMGIFRGM